MGYSPAQIRHAYGLDSINFSGITGDGTGQTIAVVNAYDNPAFVDSSSSSFNSSDLHQFDLQFGLPDPPSFKKVNQTGGKSMPESSAIWANESALDVEWAHAIAPKASIILVEANSGMLGDLLSGAVNYARNLPGVSVVNMSFGAGENSGETDFDSTFTTPAGHSGITFLAATGDAGAPGEYPSYSPNVLSVGATSLTVSSGNYGSESAYASGGGGISQYEPRPAYQASVNFSSTRMSPDVSFDGDPNTGVAVYDSFNGGPNPWYKIGGTSLSTPAWSALIAITDQGRGLSGLPSLDGATATLPRLYQINRNDFHDITFGNNGFSAKSGFDLATGLGTPKANSLIYDLGGLASISGTISNAAGGTLSKVSVYIDTNNNGALDSSEPRGITNSAGRYTITDLASGKYLVRQIVPNNFKQTTAPITATLFAGQHSTGYNFSDTSTILKAGSISGNLFNDLNGDGVRQAGEGNLVGRIFYLDANRNGHLDSGEVTAKTDNNGNYKFSNIAPNQHYRLRESVPAGLRPSMPTAWFYDVFVGNGANLTGYNFADTTKIYIGGVLFNDINADARQESAENGLAGFRVYLDTNNDGIWQTGETSVLTDSTGRYGFFSLSAGTYYVRVVPDKRYELTLPAGGLYSITLASGQLALNRQFGEHFR